MHIAGKSAPPLCVCGGVRTFPLTRWAVPKVELQCEGPDRIRQGERSLRRTTFRTPSGGGADTAFLPNATPFYARLWERMSILRFSSIIFTARARMMFLTMRMWNAQVFSHDVTMRAALSNRVSPPSFASMSTLIVSAPDIFRNVVLV